MVNTASACGPRTAFLLPLPTAKALGLNAETPSKDEGPPDLGWQTSPSVGPSSLGPQGEHPAGLFVRQSLGSSFQAPWCLRPSFPAVHRGVCSRELVLWGTKLAGVPTGNGEWPPAVRRVGGLQTEKSSSQEELASGFVPLVPHRHTAGAARARWLEVSLPGRPFPV